MAEQSLPDAVIYVPGLFQAGADQSVEMVAARIAHAEDVTSEPELTFTAKAAEDVAYEGGTARKVTILRGKDGAEDAPVVHVYTFNYIDTLVGDRNQRNPFVQALAVFFVIVRHSPRMFLSLFSKGKTLKEKAQVVYAAALYTLLFVYMVSLLYVAVGGVYDALKLAGMKADFAPLASWWRVYVDAAVVFLTALGLWKKGDTKAVLDRVAVETTAVARYLHDRIRAGAVHGRLEHFIQKIAEKRTYEKLHIVGYSFGSVIVMNTLFPTGATGPQPATRSIDTLVTIGCPFDFIRTFWPKYFDRREVVKNVPANWINIYDPNDVLGSDFTDSVGGQSQPRGIRAKSSEQVLPVNVVYDEKPDAAEGILAWFQLAGFRAHGQYWERGDVFDKNCYWTVVEELRRRRIPAASAATPAANAG